MSVSVCVYTVGCVSCVTGMRIALVHFRTELGSVTIAQHTTMRERWSELAIQTVYPEMYVFVGHAYAHKHIPSAV